MKAIKALVIGMGLLIVLGVGLLIYGLTHNTGPFLHPAAAPATATAPVTAPAAPSTASIVPAPAGGAPYFTSEVALPAGARVQYVGTAGAMVVLHVVGGEGDERILLIDPRSGHLAGTVLLTQDRQ